MSLRRTKSGFTLIEVITASAIAGVLCILLFLLADRSLFQWNMVAKAIETHREARITLDMLASDFKKTISWKNNYAISHNSTESAIRRDSIQLLTVVKNHSKGDLSLVRYYLKQHESNRDDKPGFHLYRQFIPPEKTWKYIKENNIDFGNESLEGEDEILAHNVFAFEVEFLRKDNFGNLEEFKFSEDASSPEFARIRLELVPDRIMRQLKTQAHWEELEGDNRTDIFYLLTNLKSKSNKRENR